MRWPVALFCAMTLVALGSGCHNNNDLVESELRSKDNDLRVMRDELERSAAYSRALQMELHAIKGEAPPPPGPGEPPPPVGFYPLHSLTLGRQTGGHEGPGCSGDAALQVVLEPRDCDSHVVKVMAAALIQAFEITPEGLKQPLSTWEIPPDQLRCSWRQGLWSTGYVLILPWKVWPTQPRLRVVAQLRLPDGKPFEAEKDVTIRLAPPAQRLTPPPEVPAPAPKEKEDPLLPKSPEPEKLPVPAPGPGPVLPPPAPLDKPAGPLSGGGDPAFQPVQSLYGAVQIHRPIAVPTGW